MTDFIEIMLYTDGKNFTAYELSEIYNKPELFEDAIAVAIKERDSETELTTIPYTLFTKEAIRQGFALLGQKNISVYEQDELIQRTLGYANKMMQARTFPDTKNLAIAETELFMIGSNYVPLDLQKLKKVYRLEKVMEENKTKIIGYTHQLQDKHISLEPDTLGVRLIGNSEVIHSVYSQMGKAMLPDNYYGEETVVSNLAVLEHITNTFLAKYVSEEIIKEEQMKR